MLCVCETAHCAAVRPIRRWQTDDYHRVMQQRRQTISGRRSTACDLSIQGESLATPVASHHASGVSKITGEPDFETVYRACKPKTVDALALKTRASKSATGRGSCRRSSVTADSRWYFDPFLKDDTGRMVSTKTPVAKMIAPVYRKISSAEAPATKPRNACKLSEKGPSEKRETATTSAAADRSPSDDVTRRSNNSKDSKDAANRKRQADNSDRNNSSNSRQTRMVTKSKRSGVARKSDGESADDISNRSDHNNSPNKSNSSLAEKRRRANKSDGNGTETEDAELEPELVAQLEMSTSVSAFAPDEKRRRSPSLQVLRSASPEPFCVTELPVH